MMRAALQALGRRRRIRRRLWELEVGATARERQRVMMATRGQRWQGHDPARCEYCRAVPKGKAF